MAVIYSKSTRISSAEMQSKMRIGKLQLCVDSPKSHSETYVPKRCVIHGSDFGLKSIRKLAVSSWQNLDSMHEGQKCH